MLRKIESSPERLWMGRGSHGHTSQTIIATRTGTGVDMSFARGGGGSLAVHLDAEELHALIAWLLAREEQSSSR